MGYQQPVMNAQPMPGQPAPVGYQQQPGNPDFQAQGQLPVNPGVAPGPINPDGQ